MTGYNGGAEGSSCITSVIIYMKWTEFENRYPGHADYRFSNENGKAMFLFNGDYYDPFDSAGHLKKTLYHFQGNYAPENIKDYLGKEQAWPQKFTIKKVTYPFPPIAWHSTPSKTDFSNLLIEVSPGKKINMKVRNIFKSSTTEFKSAAAAKKWLRGPNMNYWAQQLNFAVWAATAGCGVGLDMIKDSPFLQFHVIFTIRRVLRELGAPLPGDVGFNAYDSHYNAPAFERLKNEFKAPGDFRFLAPSNGGVGDPYGYDYAGLNVEEGGWPNPENRFRDEGKPKYGGPEIEGLKDARTPIQYNWFVLATGRGLVNMARINRSIEAFVYCVLGAQVNTRQSILTQETQQQFLEMFESAVIENNISKSIQRYQFAVQEAKVRLDYAVAPGCWLMPSHLIINTGHVAGYNNKLQRATADMKMGLNDVNGDVIKPPTPVVTKTKHLVEKPVIPKHTTKKVPAKKIIPAPKLPVIKEEEPYDHNLLKAGLAVAGVGFGYFMMR